MNSLVKPMLFVTLSLLRNTVSFEEHTLSRQGQLFHHIFKVIWRLWRILFFKYISHQAGYETGKSKVTGIFPSFSWAFSVA